MTRAARRALRRGPRRPAHALFALLLAVLTTSAVACGLTIVSGPSSSMATMDHAAMVGHVRPAMAMESDGPGSCLSAAGSPRQDVHSSGDCDAAHCAQVSGQPHSSCCDSPGQNGVTTTSPVMAPSAVPGLDTWYLPAAFLSHRPSAAGSGPGPPDPHMLQLLRI
ncbi:MULTISPECIES: hypothetical protein [unclassified Streptomyces]|uniref:hypothetical protein n=1 Tax=unclassified Streptomyces TaxID=2593676 RepID=UPI003D94A52B